MSLTLTLRAVSALCVVVSVLHVQRVRASTDPVASTCSPLCQDFSSVSTQCGKRRGCYDRFAHTDDAKFWRCLEPCHALGAQCYSLCASNMDVYFSGCQRQCGSAGDYDCIHQCFDRTFLAEKASKLRLPSPDIGPFNDAD